MRRDRVYRRLLVRAVVGTALAAFLGLGTLQGQSPPPPPTPPTTERVDQQPVEAWPRWAPDIPIDIDIGQVGPRDISIAIDSWGIVHAVWVRAPQGGQSTVVYANNRWATRGINGFSSPVRVSLLNRLTGPPNQLEKPTIVTVNAVNPWIEAGPDGSVHAVWEERYEVYSKGRTRVVSDVVGCAISDFAPLTAAPLESGSYVFTPDPVVKTDGRELVRFCYAPNLDVDSAGARAAVYVRERHEYIVVGGVPSLTARSTKVRYRGNAPPETVALYTGPDPEEDPGRGFVAGSVVRPWTFAALDPENVPHVAWEIGTPDENGTRFVEHAYRTGPAVWTPAPPPNNLAGMEITLASGVTGVVHAAWTGAGGAIRYARWEGGQWAILAQTEDLPLQSNGARALVYLDHRGRVVILTNAYLLRRVTAGGPAWTRRAGDLLPRDGAMDDSGILWMAGDESYTHMEDPDLGGQDPLVQMPMGPATANVVNGNLHTSIPIYSSDGVGISANLSIVYNSQDLARGPLGQGWQHNYHVYVTMPRAEPATPAFGKSAIVHFPDGRRIYFRSFIDDPDAYVPFEQFGDFSKLTYRVAQDPLRPGTRRIAMLYSKTGIRWTFNENGKLEEIRDLAGNSLLLTYTGTNKDGSQSGPQLLETIQDSAVLRFQAPRTLTLKYDAFERLETMFGPTVRQVQRKFSFLYSEASRNGQLTKVVFDAVTQPARHAWTFAYHPVTDVVAELAARRRLAHVTSPRYDADTPTVFTTYLYEPVDNRVLGCFHPAVPGPEFPSATPRVYGEAIEYDDDGRDDLQPRANSRPVAVLQDANARSGEFPSSSPVVHFDPLTCTAREIDYPASGGAFPELQSILVREYGRYRNIAAVLARRASGDTRPDRTSYVYYNEAAPQSPGDYVRDNVLTARLPDTQNPVTYTHTGSTAPSGGDAEWPAGTSTSFAPNRVRTQTGPAVLEGSLQTYTFSYDRGREQRVDRPDGTSVSRTFDAFGRIETETDGNNKTTRYGYSPTSSASGLATSVTAPGQTKPAAYKHDLLGFLESTQAPEGGLTEYSRDNLDRTTTVTGAGIETPEGEQRPVVSTAWDPDGHVTSTTDPERLATVQEWDALGRLLQVEHQNPLGTAAIRKRQFRYDANGNQLIATDWRGNTTTAEYSGMDRLRKVTTTGIPDAPIEYTYFADGSTREMKQDGRTWIYDRDGRGNTVQTTHPLANGQRVDKFKYLDNDFLAMTRVCDGDVMKAGVVMTPDKRSRAVARTDLLENPGDSMANIQGVTMRLVPDAEGNVKEVIDPSLVKAGAEYDDRGLPDVSLDARRRILAKVKSDADGNLDKLFGPNPETGGDARRVETEDGPQDRGLVKLLDVDRSPIGLPKELRDAFEVETRVKYNRRGQVREIHRHLKDEANGVNRWIQTEFFYDDLGRLERRKDQVEPGKFAEYVFTYTKNDDLESVTTPGSGTPPSAPQVYRYQHDAFHRVTSYQAPGLPDPETWEYNSRGLLETHRLSDRSVQSYQYDARGRRTGMIAGAVGMSWSYDVADRLQGASRSMLLGLVQVSVVQIFRYSGDDDPDGTLGRVHQEETIAILGAAGVTIQVIDHAPRANGQRESLSVTTPSGPTTKNQYTPGLGTLETISRQVGSAEEALVRYRVDSGGRTREKELAQLGLREVSDFDRKGRQTGLRSPHLALGYRFDSLDRCVIMTETGGTGPGITWRFRYNDLGQMTSLVCGGTAAGTAAPTVELAARRGGNLGGSSGVVRATPIQGVSVPAHEYELTYDLVGNRLTKRALSASAPYGSWTYVYRPGTNFLERAVPSSGTPIEYGYDGRGNVSTRTQGSTVETFGYDESNRMTSYLRQDGPTIQAFFQYVYTPSGQRISVQDWTDPDPSNRREQWFAFDGPDIVADQEKVGAEPLGLRALYVNGPGIDRKIARLDPTEPPTSPRASVYFLTDRLGTTRRLLDGRNEVLNSYVTSPFGEPLVTVSNLPNRYQFTGRELDSESGLYHYRARAMDPATGRFLQNDPILSRRASAHYGYASGDPVSRTDPMGLTDSGGAWYPGTNPFGVLELIRAWQELQAWAQESPSEKTAQTVRAFETEKRRLGPIAAQLQRQAEEAEQQAEDLQRGYVGAGRFLRFMKSHDPSALFDQPSEEERWRIEAATSEAAFFREESEAIDARIGSLQGAILRTLVIESVGEEGFESGLVQAVFDTDPFGTVSMAEGAVMEWSPASQSEKGWGTAAWGGLEFAGTVAGGTRAPQWVYYVEKEGQLLYVGRTAWPLRVRWLGHRAVGRNWPPLRPFAPTKLSYEAARGAEQILIDLWKPSENAIRGISLLNPNRPLYLREGARAVRKVFGSVGF